MKALLHWLCFTKWKPIKYYWPYPEGYGIYRKNRWTGTMTVVDQYQTREQALEACKTQNKIL